MHNTLPRPALRRPVSLGLPAPLRFDVAAWASLLSAAPRLWPRCADTAVALAAARAEHAPLASLASDEPPEAGWWGPTPLPLSMRSR